MVAVLYHGGTGGVCAVRWVANGSLKDLETHLLLSVRVQLAPEAEVEAILVLCEEEGRMLTALLQSLKQTE